MIVTYQFSCAHLNCKVFVVATLHMHDDHSIDLEKLAEATGILSLRESKRDRHGSVAVRVPSNGGPVIAIGSAWQHRDPRVPCCRARC